MVDTAENIACAVLGLALLKVALSISSCLFKLF